MKIVTRLAQVVTSWQAASEDFSLSIFEDFLPQRMSRRTRLERWSIFHGDEMVMFFFLQRWNGDGFENFSPSPLMVFGGINHWQQWFFNGFFQFLGPMVLDGYKQWLQIARN